MDWNLLVYFLLGYILNIHIYQEVPDPDTNLMKFAAFGPEQVHHQFSYWMRFCPYYTNLIKPGSSARIARLDPIYDKRLSRNEEEQGLGRWDHLCVWLSWSVQS